MKIAETPPPPYFAVIFTSVKSDDDTEYEETAARMLELAKDQDGFLGIESVRDGLGITVSYWRDEASIKNWKLHTEHTLAREKGKLKWYKSFKTRVARVERDYGM